MKWYYQTTPGDNWDYTAVQDIALADMTIDGEPRKVLLRRRKTASYVLDRSMGVARQSFRDGDLGNHVDMETGRPVENEALNFEENGKWVLPGRSAPTTGRRCRWM